ncbi:MAG: ROK family protein [Bacteroidetes bacterium]|uniref:ROK family protein n=1 Tax=Candidatus Merdivivens pullistercoris TaxID=2840873 RepID=A0A9D9I2E6_9BACT|nr:ROK family protein [Candidatus Merdivivens pullistercoris]
MDNNSGIKPYVVGIDIGGQTTKMGIVDARGNVLAKNTVRTDTYDRVEPYLEDVKTGLTELIKEAGAEGLVRGIGVGAPNANYYTGEIANAVNISWSAKNGVTPFARLLSEKMDGMPVTITNDANAAAMGEMAYGAAKGMKDFIMITLGTGIGSGIVINGQMVYGHDGFAGELGHTCAVRGGRACNCGRNGCLETYCSAIGVARTAREWLETYPDEPTVLRGKIDITSKDVYEAAIGGDAFAKKIFDFTGRILGENIADFVAFSAPEAIVLFGGLARSGDLLRIPLEEAMNKNLLSIWKGKIKIVFSQLKESDAAILGASALAW